MAKTKFLSKVLAVLMVLSMLCSTGVFADYNSGLLAGEAAVTGTITDLEITLNDKLDLNAALEADLAKWASTEEGIKINLAGTTSALTGTLTYVIAPVNVLAQVPLNVDDMQQQSLAIGAKDFTGGAFDVTFEVDKAKIVAGTTYELRFAYSKADIADVTDASALVYQRYIKAFDWAEGASAARVINKQGIGDITIDIQTNPVRAAVIKSLNLNADVEKGVLAAPLHIRTADLKTGDAFQIASSARVPSDFMWAGETTQTEVVTTSERGASFTEVGANLRGGVVLAPATSEQGRFFGGNAQTGNAAYRFKATNSGKIYLLAKAAFAPVGWTRVTTGVGTFDTANVTGLKYNGYLYTTREVTLEDVQTLDPGATELTTTNIYNFLKANTDLLVKAGDDKTAAGWYHGAASGKTTLQETTYHGLDEAFVSQDGYFQIPTKWTDENGEFELYYDYPNFMGIYGDYGYSGTVCRGWLRQPKTFAQSAVYTRTFEAGEWVEIPYDASTAAEDVYSAAVLQFDIPVAPLASASVTTTKSAVFSDALPMLAGEAVAFEGENYEIVVPRGTETVSFTVANVNGVESDAVTATMDAASKVVKATIGDAEYDITVKYDDAYPTIYNYKNNSSYDKLNRIAIQYGDMGTPTVGGKKTNAPDGSALTSLGFRQGAVKPALTKDLLVIGTYDNKGQSHMTGFDWKEKTNANGMTFNVSKGATVYVKSVAYGAIGSPSLEAAGFEQVGTLENYPLYAKHFNAGAAVSIPTEPVTQAELDAYNATLTGTKRWAFVDDTNKGLKLDDGTTAIPSGAVGLPIQWNIDAEGNLVSAVNNTGKNVGKPVYYTRNQATTFYVEFDTPLALGEVTYAVDGGDADAIAFEAGETTANIEVPYNATTVSVAATKTGTGTVTVAPAELDLTGVASGTVTVTLAAPGAEPIVYTINFVKGAPKLLWESALAPTGSLETQNQGANRNLYKNGLYNVGAQEGSLDLTATEIDLVVPYGVEVVKLNGDVSVNLLSAKNHAATAIVTINGTDYTVNVSWAAYEYKEGMPYVYDLEYGVEGKTALYADSYVTTDKNGKETTVKARYYAVPTALVLDAAHDLVLGEGDLLGTNGTDRETITLKKLEGTWFTEASHKASNLSATNNGGGVNRLHLAATGFETWVVNGDLDSKYALNGATILVADYTDVVANNAMRYKFKTAIDGYVLVACYKANSAFTAADGWTLLEGNRVRLTNGSTSANTTALSKPPIIDGVEHVNAATSFASYEGACDFVYIKKVDAGEVVEIKEAAVSGDHPPIVIVATEDMINERIAAPTLLASLSYTTALVSNSKWLTYSAGDSANARDGGFYQPALISDAATVAVAEDATTVNVTVPYGTEIVNLAGTDTYEAAVAFDAINLINNNGAATVKKTVGEVEYTINVAWAAYDDATMGLPAGNLVYDVKYKVNNLAADTFYNILPTRIALETTRIYPINAQGYTKSGTDYVPYTSYDAAPGKWSPEILVKTNSTVHSGAGAGVTRGRLGIGSFAPWVEAGLVTESGVPGDPVVKGEEETDAAFDARVDAIAYNAMNGAGLFVTNWKDTDPLDQANGVNADMAERYSFKVAQDSIVYVATNSTAIGAEWTKFSDDAALDMYGGAGTVLFVENEAGEYVKAGYYGSFNYHNQGTRAYYRYAKAGDTVTVTLNYKNGSVPPVILVRPMDFDAIAAPTFAGATFKIGEGEATAVEFAEGATEATIDVAWGTTDAISVAAEIAGAGSVVVSDAITLSKADSDGAITVTVKDAFGEVVATYTINFVWGAAPAVEAVTYETATTIYKTATVKGVALDAETQTVEVPWGTAYATVSYKLEGQDAVKLAAVNVISGAGSVDVELPEETITITFVWGAAPAGQYVTNLTKHATTYKDRFFATFTADNMSAMAGKGSYGDAGIFFFTADSDYSAVVPAGLAKKGYTVVIADADSNRGHSAMTQNRTEFTYLTGNYPATSIENAWVSFNVAKSGMVYAVSSRADGEWAYIEALGWEKAPFTFTYGSENATVYQKYFNAGDLVLIPNNPFTAEEMEYVNAQLEASGADYRFNMITEEIYNAIKDRGDFYSIGYGEYAWAKQYLETSSKYADVADDFGLEFGTNKNDITIAFYQRPVPATIIAVADEFVAAEAKAPQYTGKSSMVADEAIELTATPAAYAAKGGEITFAIKSGAQYATLDGTTLTGNRTAWTNGAAVVIEITQTFENGTTLVSEATIAINKHDETKYGSITVFPAEGSGLVEGTINGELVIDGSTEGVAAEFAAGEILTLKATPAEDYKFLYWAIVDAEGKVQTAYEYADEFSLNIGYGLRLKAIFAEKNPTSFMVTFKGYQGAIVEQYRLSAIAEDYITVPAAPAVYGYTATEYNAPGFAEPYAVGAEILKSMFNKDVTFTADYVKDASITYSVNVTGGTIEGYENGTNFEYNTPVTVVAGEAEEGKVFAYWTENGKIVCYEDTYTFYMAAADRNLVAVFAEEEAAKVPVLTMVVTNTGNDVYRMFAERRVPENYTVIENGIIWGIADTETEADEMITWANVNVTSNPKGYKASKVQNPNGQYTVGLEMTAARKGAGKNWYARTYVKVRDTSGATDTFYSEPALIWEYVAE